MKTPAPDILVVDDDPSDIDLVLQALLRNGSAASLEIARDGVEALDCLLESAADFPGGGGALPRLVLLDLNMPLLDGFRVLESLRADARTRLLPVVIFSSSGQEADRVEAQRLGANEYVRKPATFGELRAILARLERDWLGAGKAG